MGGGRTLRANTVRRYFADWVCRATLERRTKIGRGVLAIVATAAVRAATQTAHFSESELLEWWCATAANADHAASTRHKHARTLANERIPHFCDAVIYPYRVLLSN